MSGTPRASTGGGSGVRLRRRTGAAAAGSGSPGPRRAAAAAICLALALGATAGCDLLRRSPGEVPTREQALALYGAYPELREVSVSGNVVELRFHQDGDQLRRGGSLWARAGVYIYLLSPATQRLFEEYPGTAAVRAMTFENSGREVARAQLHRDALSELHWRRTLNLLGRALQEGSSRPTLLEDLALWGEEHTEHSYNPEYVPESRAREQ